MNVKREQKKARDEMMKELYGLHRQMGYQSDMNTFAGALLLLSNPRLLLTSNRLHGLPKTAVPP